MNDKLYKLKEVMLKIENGYMIFLYSSILVILIFCVYKELRKMFKKSSK